MKSAYASYKGWWLEHQAEIHRELCYDERVYWPDLEETFAVYWNNFSNYQIYEILEDWSNNQEIPEGN